MIYQTDKRLPEALQHYGCYFTALAYYREKYQGLPWTAEDLAAAWSKAISLGIISGDLNHDGDLDDPGEATIEDTQGLCRLLGLNLQYVPGHFAPETPAAVNHYVIAAWHNDRTGFTHFVVGTKRPVEFDPIEGGSVTVREGVVQSLRIFQRI